MGGHATSAKRSLELLVMDYLTRLTPADPRAQRYRQIAEMTGALEADRVGVSSARSLSGPVGRAARAKGKGVGQAEPSSGNRRYRSDADVVVFCIGPSGSTVTTRTPGARPSCTSRKTETARAATLN